MLERKAKLYFDYTMLVLEKLIIAAKKGPQEYFRVYEMLRPEEESGVKSISY